MIWLGALDSAKYLLGQVYLVIHVYLVDKSTSHVYFGVVYFFDYLWIMDEMASLSTKSVSNQKVISP